MRKLEPGRQLLARGHPVTLLLSHLGPQPRTTLELPRNPNPSSHSRPPESEALKMELNSLCLKPHRLSLKVFLLFLFFERSLWTLGDIFFKCLVEISSEGIWNYLHVLFLIKLVVIVNIFLAISLILFHLLTYSCSQFFLVIILISVKEGVIFTHSWF